MNVKALRNRVPCHPFPNHSVNELVFVRACTEAGITLVVEVQPA
jgi:hypothetical protein